MTAELALSFRKVHPREFELGFSFGEFLARREQAGLETRALREAELREWNGERKHFERPQHIPFLLPSKGFFFAGSLHFKFRLPYKVAIAVLERVPLFEVCFCVAPPSPEDSLLLSF